MNQIGLLLYYLNETKKYTWWRNFIYAKRCASTCGKSHVKVI